jgi:ubiquinone/menaquinone biosynthesis C-methylase UbiE
MLDFLSGRTEQPSASQQLMESSFYAPIYERYARPSLTRTVSRRTITEEYRLARRLLRLKPHCSVLDVACGTGNFMRRFVSDANAGGVVVGVDRSVPMLARGETIRLANDLESLYFVHGDALHLPLVSGSFERVHCAGALHLMADIPRALSEMRRVLRDGGVFVVSTFIKTRAPRILAARFLIGRRAGFEWFDPEELRELLRRTGFLIDWESTSGAAFTLRAVAV